MSRKPLFLLFQQRSQVIFKTYLANLSSCCCYYSPCTLSTQDTSHMRKGGSAMTLQTLVKKTRKKRELNKKEKERKETYHRYMVERTLSSSSCKPIGRSLWVLCWRSFLLSFFLSFSLCACVCENVFSNLSSPKGRSWLLSQAPRQDKHHDNNETDNENENADNMVLRDWVSRRHILIEVV